MCHVLYFMHRRQSHDGDNDINMSPCIVSIYYVHSILVMHEYLTYVVHASLLEGHSHSIVQIYCTNVRPYLMFCDIHKDKKNKDTTRPKFDGMKFCGWLLIRSMYSLAKSTFFRLSSVEQV